jgi:hypothetical protein
MYLLCQSVYDLEKSKCESYEQAAKPMVNYKQKKKKKNSNKNQNKQLKKLRVGVLNRSE